MVLILILYKINEQNTKFELTKQTRGFSGGSDGNKSACNTRDLGSIPESGRPLKKEMATHSSILARNFPGFFPHLFTKLLKRIREIGEEEEFNT